MPNYLEPEYEPHFTAWKQTPSPETSGALLSAVQPVVNSALRSYGGPAADSPTLLGKAKLMTLHAFERYDPSRAKLRTHLLSQLQGLRRAAAREYQVVKLPEQFGIDSQRLSEGEKELRDRLGREPADHELADHLSMSPLRIARLRKAGHAIPESAAERISEDGASTWSPGVIAPLSDKAKDTWTRAIMLDLSPTDQVILRHTLGLDGHPKLANQAIARKLGLSPGAISQRKAKIQTQLDSIGSALGE